MTTGQGIRRPRADKAFTLVIAPLIILGLHHGWSLTHRTATNLELIATGAFLWLCFTVAAPYFHRDRPTPPPGSRAARNLNTKRITVVVPAHNEDPAMFTAMLHSITSQTHLPDRLHIVENGYPEHKLQAAFTTWRATACPPGLDAVYTHRVPAGKRDAQAEAFRADPTADIFITVDSDIRLDSEAIALGIAPFTSRKVQSVAGLLVGQNPYTNLLTRLVELGFVCSFLNGRAAWSVLGSVGVNCGGLAFYRANVIRKYLGHYLTQTVAGRVMSYGDDAMLTRYCLLEGQTVFQLGCWGYTLHPVRMAHLAKQRTRWWRSFFWGNLWLLRTFSPRRAIWWLTAAQAVRFAWFTVALPYVVVVAPWRTGVLPLLLLAWVAGVSYLAGARYLAIRRPGEPAHRQFVTFALAPLAGLLNVYLGPVLQYVGLATCLHTGWSTRQTVEVGLEPTPAAVVR